MDQDLDDTICAVATPPGEGGIGIIRVSGKDAIALTSQVVKPRHGRPLDTLLTHTLHLSDVQAVVTAGSASPPGNLDEALVVVMRGPHSFTGEDVVEIHTHGGPYVVQATCEALGQVGMRLAAPGEFTRRAFLNGRLDLTQAEAVLDTIRASTASSLKVAQSQLRGHLSQEVSRIRNELLRLLAHIEAGMDFVEEDMTFVETGEIQSTLSKAFEDLQQLVRTYAEGRILREGIRVAIIGRPNVGKSSLLNALLQVDRVIVSSIPGTTRDVVDEVVNIQGVSMRIVDTAGLRHTQDAIEQEGIKRTRDAITQAELILMVIDGSRGLCEEDRALLQEGTDQKRLCVINKCDLPLQVERSDVEVMGEGIRVSAQTGEGLDELRETMRKCVLRRDFEPGESIVVGRARHHAALVRAKDSVTNALDSVTNQLSGDVIALDIRSSLDSLGEMTGEVSSEEVLDHIFREFCIGK
ncbi:MAG: tRNA uridine-5-carboxymethylaminomethyl(34) synthesis GTPase MnmE [Nitrospirales bacterium]|nr:tRNA uridine-5-carboxymethylaminomethyl(34) synthesis GTPase MnmE [Nitrospirales bacterium]